MQLTNRRILITGGAGFIGANLCRAFVEQNEVICLDNLITGKLSNIKPLLKNSNFRFIEGDIRNAETCREALFGVDVVLHQAALGSVPRSINNPTLTNAINIDGFLVVLDEAVKAGVPRFVYAASSSTYGDSTELPKVESRIGKPLSPYAVTKYVNELYADVFHRLHGIEVIGLRYFNVFGRLQDPNGAYAAAIPKFIRALMHRESPEIYGDGEQTRDFTYIDNVIQANDLAATVQNAKALNQVYNIAYGCSTSLNTLAYTLKDLLSAYDPGIGEVEIKYGPPRVGDIRDSLASIEKAKEQLGYHPDYSLQSGLNKAIAWYWEHLR
jgi:UDP-N-acetylglucosamine 4-epimerase